jgi:hypothetical protein
MLEKAKKNAQENQENLITWAFQKMDFLLTKAKPYQNKANRN